MTRVTYVQHDGERRTIDVDPGTSVMKAAVANDVPGIVAECGGSMMRATCHVYVSDEHLVAVAAVGEEEDELPEATTSPRTGASRLSCQLAVSDDLDKLTSGFETARALREYGHEGPITIVTDERRLPYERPPLSTTYLAGKAAFASIAFRDRGFYRDRHICLLSGHRAVSIDRRSQTLHLDGHPPAPYDHLVLATGAVPILPPAPGRADRRVLTSLLDMHRAAGVRLEMNCRVSAIEPSHSGGHAVRTATGERIAADVVVLAVGARPRTGLAQSAGLPVNNGITVAHSLLTRDPAVSAIGDCANVTTANASSGVRLESVQNATDQARHVAARIAGTATTREFRAVPRFWSHQGAAKLQIAGLTAGSDRSVVVPGRTHASTPCFRGRRFVGVESLNEPWVHLAGRRLLQQGFGPSVADAAQPGFDLIDHAKARM